MTVGDCAPLSFPERVRCEEGWHGSVDGLTPGSTQAQTNQCFKIDCTETNHYRAHLPVSIKVREGPHKRGEMMEETSRSHTSVHTALLNLIRDSHLLLRLCLM